MRDPVFYRIRKVEPSPHRTDKWSIYPTYDFTHGICDSLEGITHSICTLEFEVHRPLYDWILDELGVHHPQQIEFARLNISHTLLSKRKLLELVDKKYVSGWDDPRMPTISGLRRGLYPGIDKKILRRDRGGQSRQHYRAECPGKQYARRLNKTAPRAMAVLARSK